MESVEISKIVQEKKPDDFAPNPYEERTTIIQKTQKGVTDDWAVIMISGMVTSSCATLITVYLVKKCSKKDRREVQGFEGFKQGKMEQEQNGASNPDENLDTENGNT